MKCQICGKAVDQVFLSKQGQRCRECQQLTDAQCYALLRQRLNASINEWPVLAHEAYERKDDIGVWEAGQHIKQLEGWIQTMRKPQP